MSDHEAPQSVIGCSCSRRSSLPLRAPDSTRFGCGRSEASLLSGSAGFLVSLSVNNSTRGLCLTETAAIGKGFRCIQVDCPLRSENFGLSKRLWPCSICEAGRQCPHSLPLISEICQWAVTQLPLSWPIWPVKWPLGCPLIVRTHTGHLRGQLSDRPLTNPRTKG